MRIHPEDAATGVPPFADDRLLREEEIDDDFGDVIEKYAHNLPGNGRGAAAISPDIFVLENLRMEPLSALLLDGGDISFARNPRPGG